MFLLVSGFFMFFVSGGVFRMRGIAGIVVVVRAWWGFGMLFR